jgi:hypothetical protein
VLGVSKELGRVQCENVVGNSFWAFIEAIALAESGKT